MSQPPIVPGWQFGSLGDRQGLEVFVQSNAYAAMNGRALEQFGVDADLVQLALMGVDVPGDIRQLADTQLQYLRDGLAKNNMDAEHVQFACGALGRHVLRLTANNRVN
ncbi:MAG TPA: hypothetical protein VF466_04740 [Candidatus Saccharimonadales bacterium]